MASLSSILRKVTGGADRPASPAPSVEGRVLLVGGPNVGKSAVFNALTGRYATVSNYPGTTVEVARARSRRLGGAEVVDTPGMYGLVPITAEERVARALLMEGDCRAVVHVVDAKNLARMLPLTLQMIEARLPVVVALNMSDEARRAGVRIDARALEQRLGVPVVATTATTGEGIAELIHRISALPAERPQRRVDYGPDMERALATTEALLADSPPLGGELAVEP